MPTIRDLRVAARETVAPLLFDETSRQAIHSVAVTPEPEGATVAFDTVLPCWATVELFRMVTGKVDLDIEKANRERIEVELFGDARLRHRVRFFDLPQERRFWFRISVPGEGPGTALGQKKIRHRGWFSTFRRTATCGIDFVKLLSDSDSESAGDLSFEVAAYDAARGDARLDFALSGEHTVESGGRVRAPFGKVLDLGRAPDRVAVHVWGTDDDENGFVSFLVAPWEGLAIRGRQPPFRRPPLFGPHSDRLRDSNDLEMVATLPVTVGRHEVRLSGATPIAALAFEVLGRIDCSVRDVLGQPARVSFDKLRASALVAPGRIGGQKTESGSLLLTLGEAGELLWREQGARATGWRELPGPPLDHLRFVVRPDAPPLLLSVDREGCLHVAVLERPLPEPPLWRATGLVQTEKARRAPAVAEAGERLFVALRDPRGRLLLATVEPDGEPRMLAEGIEDDPVLGADGRGLIWAACRDRSGRVLAGPVEAGAIRCVDGEVEELLGIGGSAETGPVLVAYDREGRVLARALESGEGWVDLGTLQEVVEPESLAPPAPEAGAAAL